MPAKLLFTVAILLLFSACQKEQVKQTKDLTLELNGSAGAAASTMLDTEKPGYILRTTGNFNTSLTAIRARLAQIGAKETGQVKALNMVFVSSDAPNFVEAMAGLNVKIGANLKVYKPTSIREPQLVGDNPPSSGNNNALFPLLWGMDAIDAPQAWNANYRGAGATVAVLDEGFYINHPDLAANLLTAKARNFVNLDDLGAPFCGSYPECDPTDVTFKLTGFSHGTHVAGTIAAVDNSIGVIGVAPQAKVIPVKCLSDYAGFGLFSWISSAIVYAADQNVDVINMSLGGLDMKGLGKESPLVQEGIKAVKDAIQYAYNKGVTVICAAGNDGLDLNHTGSLIVLPGSSPHAISVAATSPYGFAYDPTADLDIPSSYTNYGTSFIDFSGPGGDFDHPGSLFFYDMVLSTSGPAQYYFAAGTSMATPHVAGVAALIIGKYGHGTLTPTQVKAKLKSGSDDLGKPGKDPYFGMGRVNAYKSVQ